MQETSFLVMTDLHADVMPDGVARAQIIADAAVEQKVDFMIQLGDMQYPDQTFLEKHCPEGLPVMREKRPWAVGRDDEKFAIRTLFSQTGIPLYSVVGNHDLHVCDKATLCRYWNLPAAYYAFVEHGIRFLVLDTNYIRMDNGLQDIACGNSSGKGDARLRFLPDAQIRWLDDQLKASAEPCILLSHASLADPLSGIHEQEKVHAVLQKYGHEKVWLAMNGHGHVDGLRTVNGIPFWDVNSASYHSTGKRYPCIRYGRKLCEAYQKLPFTAPYAAPLYAIVHIRKDGICIQGRQSAFVGPSPQTLGVPEDENDYPPTAGIADRWLPFHTASEDV